MNWRDIEWDIPTLGRLAGIAIIVAGIVLAMLDASAFDLRSTSGVGGWFRFRYFMLEATGFVWQGGLVFAAAEIADRLGLGGRGTFDWQGVRVLALLGVAVFVITTVLSTWNVVVDVSELSASETARVLMSSVIRAAWRGGILIVAAALADRIGWPEESGEDSAAEAPA
jgi:hypothetical protein